MSEEWTTSDDAELKRLRRKKARIDRNTNRKHKYSPRSTVRNKETSLNLTHSTDGKEQTESKNL